MNDKNEKQENIQPVDPVVLGKIILLQSTLHVMDNPENMARFICRGLAGLSGISGIAMFLNGTLVTENLMDDLDLREYKSIYQSLKSGFSGEQKSVESDLDRLFQEKGISHLKIATSFRLYGLMFFKTHAYSLFLQYKPYIENTMNLVALVVENYVQKKELLEYQETLKTTVKIRTEKLRESYKKLSQSYRNSKREIAERSQTEKSLWETRNMLSKVFDQSPIGMVLVRKNGIFSQVNRYFCEMMGYSEQELLKMNFQDLTHPDDQQTGSEIFHKLFSGETEQASLQKRYLRKNGEVVHGFLTSTMLRDSRNRPTYLFTQIQNITDRVLSEQALRKAQDELERKVEERTAELAKAKELAEAASLAKSEFLANISHELRNPMHHILSYSKYGIEKISEPKEKLNHYFSQIRKSASRLMFLVNDLLDFSKLESGRMNFNLVQTDISGIINEIVTEIRASDKNRDRFHISLPEGAPVLIECDPFKFGQVMRNLLSNAVRYSPENGLIRVELCCRDSSIKGYTRLPAIQVSVLDQGVGVPENELTLIFEKFTQSSRTKTGAGGTGLGLSICQEIIKGHSGKIWAENLPEGGSAFHFLLPVHQAK